MARFFGIARDSSGNTIGVATVTVFVAGTSTLAVIYSNSGLSVPQANPFTSNADGTYSFFSAPGDYKIRIQKTGFSDFEQDYIPVGAIADHGQLTGLADDDHAQYAALAGRLGGQTLRGGTASGQSLTLQSTSHATKGSILFGASSALDEVNTRLGIGTTGALTTLHSAAGSRLPAGEVGGILVTGATTNERMASGYETGVGGWLQSTLSGTSQTSLRLNPVGGHVGVGGTPSVRLGVIGSDANNTIGAGAAAALRITNSDSGAAGRLAELQFGCSSTTKYAAISGSLTNGGTNTTGQILMGTRGATTDGDLTTRFRLDESGRVTIGTTVAGTTCLLNIWSLLDGVTSGLEVRNASSGHAIQIYQDNTNGRGVIRTPGFTHLSFGTLNTDRLLIDTTANFYFNTNSIGASSTGVLSIGNAAAIPSSNATNAYMIYVQAGALKGRGTSGTITTIGVADPHCPKCGKDFALEWESEQMGYLAVCMWCLTEGLGADRGVFSRRESDGSSSAT